MVAFRSLLHENSLHRILHWRSPPLGRRFLGLRHSSVAAILRRCPRQLREPQ